MKNTTNNALNVYTYYYNEFITDPIKTVEIHAVNWKDAHDIFLNTFGIEAHVQDVEMNINI